MPKETKNKKINQERLLPLDVPTKDSNKVSKKQESIEDEKPPFETTTLWDYPKQSYGKKPKGDNKFQGVTPAFIIWNMIQRYTKPGDLSSRSYGRKWDYYRCL